MRTFAAYFCTFQLRPLQRDKSSCVPGTTSPRSTLFPASSLFLAFFFAPTFWLSFLPSQVFFICGSKGRALSTKTRMDIFAYVNLTFFFSLSLSLTIYLSIYLSIHPSIHPSILASIHLSIYRCKFHRGLVLKHLKTSCFFHFFFIFKVHLEIWFFSGLHFEFIFISAFFGL